LNALLVLAGNWTGVAVNYFLINSLVLNTSFSFCFKLFIVFGI
jgi:hypothetical protein